MVRQVVTGQAPDGTSAFVADHEVEPVTCAAIPGCEFLQLWAHDTTPSLPTDGLAGRPVPGTTRWYPPAGGVRFALFTLPPEGTAPAPDVDLMASLLGLDARLPGLLEPLEPDDPGMHTTDTVDLEVILSGEVWLELDGGEERLLRAGDTVVQNGTRHRWHNRGSVPAVMALVLVGASRRSGD